MKTKRELPLSKLRDLVEQLLEPWKDQQNIFPIRIELGYGKFKQPLITLGDLRRAVKEEEEQK